MHAILRVDINSQLPLITAVFFIEKKHEMKMKINLVDSKYYGHIMRAARRSMNLSRHELSKRNGISVHDIRQYEIGVEIIPDTMLTNLFRSWIFLCIR